MRKNSIGVHIEKNALVDDGDGTISFQGGQVIVDDTEMWSGYKYDIKSLDINSYKGQVTADHIDSLQTLIGKVTKVYKKGNKVLIDGIRFAIEASAMARLAYDLIKGGFLTDFSVETLGPWPGEDDRTYHDAFLVGLSAVVVGNNKSATINQLVLNSIAQSKAAGLDTSELEKAVHAEEEPEKQEPEDPPTPPKKKVNKTKQEPEDMKFVTIKNTRGFAAKVAFKNAAGEDVETELAAGQSVDVSEDQQETVEKQLNSAQAPQADVTETVKNAVAEARKEDADRIKKLEGDLTTFKEAFDKSAKEPEFRKPGEHEVKARNSVGSGKIGEMDWKERTALQLQSLQASFGGSREASETVHAINQFNLEELQKEGVVSNAVDLPDLGNFVIPRQMITEIKEQASNYRPLLDVFRFEETMSLETAWLKGTGEIDMQDVDMDDNDDNEDLKPISTPTFATDTSRLYEFAAVTPVKASAVRFAAADLVQHLTKLYKRAYDRRLAQSVIGRLEKAVESNGNSTAYNFSSAAGGNVEALIALITSYSEIAEHSPNGVFLMTEASRLHLLAMALRSGINGPLSSIFTNDSSGLRFIGKPFVIVPSDLMPSLNTAATKSWSFEETSVTVNHGVLLADPTDFVGKVSGGLNFQVSDVAPYEESGTVKSAWQRDELVFRGYGFRASGLYFDENVSGVLAPGIS